MENYWGVKPLSKASLSGINAYVVWDGKDIHNVILAKSEVEAMQKYEKKVREDFKGEEDAEHKIEYWLDEVSVEEVKHIIY